VKIYQKFVNTLLLVIFISYPLYACTIFVLKRDGKVLLAKNLDWFIDDGFIVVNKRGVKKVAFEMNDGDPVKWESRYGSITFNQFGKEFPLGGMNEEGLVIEETSYSLSQYPSEKKNVLNEFQWVQYQLDNSKSVDEVIKSLNKITISPLLFKLHYMVCDQQGHVAIIEFIEGKIKVYTGDKIVVPVLTNNSYQNSLKYLKHHQGFGGERTVSNGPESQERFVRVATLIKIGNKINNTLKEDDAFNILNSVKQTDTQWSIVYNLSAKEIHFRTQQIATIRTISLHDFNFEDSDEIGIITKHDTTKIKQLFEKYSIDKNIQLIRSVFKKLIKAGEIKEVMASEIQGRMVDYLKDK